MAQTVDQVRARLAWELVSSLADLDERERKEFGTEAKRLGPRILASGLGQAVAFLRAKAKDKKPALTQLLDGLDRAMAERLPRRQGGSAELIRRIVEGDSAFLRRATGEALAYVQWVARFAEAEGLTGDDE